uniref:Uncharacterized protein n=1 Tax=Dunaliella tertiolecta TaxID=3047 RepID=A0A7S3R8K0_DUNTE
MRQVCVVLALDSLQAVLGQSQAGERLSSPPSEGRASLSGAEAIWNPSKLHLSSTPGSQSNSAPLPRLAPPANSAVVDELLGARPSGTNAGPESGAPISSGQISNPLGLASANAAGGQLVQIVDAEGQVGYYYNE